MAAILNFALVLYNLMYIKPSGDRRMKKGHDILTFKMFDLDEDIQGQTLAMSPALADETYECTTHVYYR